MARARPRARSAAAVRRRLVADVPLGALLSGGHRLEHRRRRDGAGVDAARADVHGRLRRRALRRAPLRARRRRALRDRARGDRARAGRGRRCCRGSREAFDEPLGDEAALPLFLVCERGAPTRHRRAHRRRRRRVVRRLRALRRRTRSPAASHVPGVRHGARGRSGAVGRASRRSTAVRAARFLEVAALPARRALRAADGGLPRRAPRASCWTPTSSREPSPGAGSCSARHRPTGSPACSCSTSQTYLPGDLLLKADIASMAHSLELRSPFLDHEVLELGVSLPDRAEDAGPARQGGAPARVRGRPAAPRSPTAARPASACRSPHWFRERAARPRRRRAARHARASRGQLRPRAVERLLDEHVDGRADHGHRLWCLLMLELWQQVHLDPPAPGAGADLEAARATA